MHSHMRSAKGSRTRPVLSEAERWSSIKLDHLMTQPMSTGVAHCGDCHAFALSTSGCPHYTHRKSHSCRMRRAQQVSVTWPPSSLSPHGNRSRDSSNTLQFDLPGMLQTATAFVLCRDNLIYRLGVSTSSSSFASPLRPPSPVHALNHIM